MCHVLLLQLPIPQLNFGHQTGNIPFGAACLHQAAAGVPGVQVEILSQALATYSGDAALLDFILARRPSIIGCTVYLWNIERTLHLARRIKQHYTPRIVLGGPEVTRDNVAIRDDAIDFYAYGEGERLFVQLLENPELWRQGSGQGQAESGFTAAPSPYLTAPLTPDLENTMLLETMRGCPYRCAYCFYNKSHQKPVFKSEQSVLEGIDWAREQNVTEIYLLDPSLNNRPGLKGLLKKIADRNRDQRLTLISEILAEAVDDELADLLTAAGFNWLEVGLQSTNPAALKAMRRKTNLKRFAQGSKRLMERGITPAVDLIVGLPQDDLNGFRCTARFVVDNELHHDIQVFPLSLIPGTEFRKTSGPLGLKYDPTPPYTIISTPTFGEEEILEAFDLAEEQFDIALYPLPDLDPAYRTGKRSPIGSLPDLNVQIDGIRMTYKVVLRKGRAENDLRTTVRCLTHPYQVIVPPEITPVETSAALSILTQINPFTPLEVIFFEPEISPDIHRLLSAVNLARPHYLDNDLRLLYPEPGNRAVLFTIVSEKIEPKVAGPMQRHIYWWKKDFLPTTKALDRLEENGFSGILVDSETSEDRIQKWQDDMILKAEEMLLIGFGCTRWHKRWLQKSASEDYCFQVLP